MKPFRLAVFAPVALLMVAACEQTAAPPAPSPQALNPGPPLTPNPMPPTYVGRWAPSPQLCQQGAWVFDEKGLTTAQGVSCIFTQATPNDTGWIAEGSCMSEGSAKPVTLVLNTARAGPQRTVAISGGPFSPAPVLTACDASSEEASSPPETRALDAASAIDRRIASPNAPVRSVDFTQNGLIAKAWREGDDVIRITEPLIGGVGRKVGERIYYFQAGDSDPFFVRDVEAAYAFESGDLTAVYSLENVPLEAAATPDRAQLERRILERAGELKTAAQGEG